MIPLTLADAASASSSATTIITILGGLIVALIAIAGGVGTWAALRVAKNSQIIANYKATAESWENRANSLKAEKEGLEDQLRTAAAVNTSLQAKNSALQDLATGNPAVEKLTTEVNKFCQDLAGQIARIESSLKGTGHVGSIPAQPP